MLVYIAAPLGDPDPVVRAWHRERANLLAALAFALGHDPICVHAYSELAIGPDTDARSREQGLKAASNVVKRVAWADGALWTLLRDDGTRSAGCELELQVFIEAGHAPFLGIGFTWARWRKFTSNHSALVPNTAGLLAEFDRLAIRPATDGPNPAPQTPR